MAFEVKKPNPPLQFRGILQRRKKTTRIVLHHYHSTSATVHDVHRWHLGNGWAGIGYNMVVDSDGTIWEGRGIDVVGAHAKGNNADSIGIACQGRFDDHTREMSDAQFNGLVWLIKHTREIYGNLPLERHGDLGNTACPGRYFPWEELLRLDFRGSAVTNRHSRNFDVLRKGKNCTLPSPPSVAALGQQHNVEAALTQYMDGNGNKIKIY